MSRGCRGDRQAEITRELLSNRLIASRRQNALLVESEFEAGDDVPEGLRAARQIGHRLDPDPVRHETGVHDRLECLVVAGRGPFGLLAVVFVIADGHDRAEGALVDGAEGHRQVEAVPRENRLETISRRARAASPVMGIKRREPDHAAVVRPGIVRSRTLVARAGALAVAPIGAAQKPAAGRAPVQGEDRVSDRELLGLGPSPGGPAQKRCDCPAQVQLPVVQKDEPAPV